MNTGTQMKTHVWNVLNTLVTAVHFTQSSKRYLTGHRIRSLKLLYCKNPTVFTAASPLHLIREGFKAYAEQVHLIQIRRVIVESQLRTQLWSFCLRRASFFSLLQWSGCFLVLFGIVFVSNVLLCGSGCVILVTRITMTCAAYLCAPAQTYTSVVQLLVYLLNSSFYLIKTWIHQK